MMPWQYSITFTSDGNPSTRPSNSAPDLMLINYDKFSKLGKIAIEFRRYQEVCLFPGSNVLNGILADTLILVAVQLPRA